MAKLLEEDMGWETLCYIGLCYDFMDRTSKEQAVDTWDDVNPWFSFIF